MVLLLVTSALVSEQVVQLYLVAYENQSLHTRTYFALSFCLFVLQRAWQGDEIASVHLSNIVGEDIASFTCTRRYYIYIASFM